MKERNYAKTSPRNFGPPFLLWKEVAVKTVDLFNLYVGERRPDPPWSEYEIGGLTVRLTDDYDAKVPQLAKPARWVITEKEAKRLPPHKGTWQVTATVSWKDSKEKSFLLHEEPNDEDNDGGLWDLCNLLTFLTGRRVVTTEYKRRYSPDAYGDYAVADIETLKAASLAWQNRENLVSKNLHTALLLYNEANAAINTTILQVRAALYSTALNVILDKHEMTYQKVSKNIRKKIKEEISNVLNRFEQTEDLQPDQADRYRRLLDRIDDGPTLTDKLFSLLQSFDIIDSPPTYNQEILVKRIGIVRNRLVHTGRPKIEGLDDEQSKIHTIKIVTQVIPEIIRIVIGHNLGFRSGETGSHCQSKDNLIGFFSKGVFREQREQEEFEQIVEYVLKKNAELYRRLS